MMYSLALLGYVLSSAYATYSLWLHYLAVMNLKRARDAGMLTKTTTALGTPLLFRGYLLDVYVNVLVMSALLLEFPRELTVTARLKRHDKDAPRGAWSRKVVQWFRPLLDPFDPKGKHV